MTAVYNLGKAAPCTLRFHVATEGGWNAGGSAGCLTAAGLVALGVPLPICILLSLFGVGASFLLIQTTADLAGQLGANLRRLMECPADVVRHVLKTQADQSPWWPT